MKMTNAGVIVVLCASGFAVGGVTPGTGLNAFWWEANMTSVSQIPSSAPNGSFIATAVDYPAGPLDQTDDQTTTVAAFIAPDDGSLSGADSADMEDKAFAFRGMLRVESADDTDGSTPGIQVVFAIGSNDGATLTAGCEIIIDNDGVHPFTTGSGTHTFDAPGLHRVELRYMTNNNDSGIEWWSSIDAPIREDAPSDTVGIVPVSRLYPLEPCAVDLAPPIGVLDLADINAFISGFVSQDLPADQNGDCLFDLADINLFVSAFVGGCP
jgi:hypothetical protein